MILRYDRYDSPIGTLTLVATERGLAAILFPPEKKKPWEESLPTRLKGVETLADTAPLAAVRRWLDLYFAGRRVRFEDYAGALDPGGTAFQKRVWDRLKRIPYGQTTTYGDLARALGQPTATRAVGMANGSNPLPILVPCHRVIGAGGKLTGFGGGLKRKAALLRLEQGGDLFDQAEG